LQLGSTRPLLRTLTATGGQENGRFLARAGTGKRGWHSHRQSRSKMRELTASDLNRPIVAVGWNSERFDGCNLALRLAALGYTRVYWYRGAGKLGRWRTCRRPTWHCRNGNGRPSAGVRSVAIMAGGWWSVINAAFRHSVSLTMPAIG
jgi:hypothetical protein